MKPDQNLTEPSRAQSHEYSSMEKPAVSSGFCEADERARTVDLLHGKQTLYQLSYIREGAEYSRGQAPDRSSASFTRLSASSLCSRRTAV